MKRILHTTAIAAAALIFPAAASAQYYNTGYTPHEQCKKKEDDKQIIGGLIGAVAGGVLGSQVSGSGARTEGSAIGAVLGGLAGAGIADKSIDCDPSYPVAATSRYYGNDYNRPYTAPSGYDTEQTTYGQNLNVYEDRVTVSNHPVYSDPAYGADFGSGAVSQGTTYTTDTVTYPPRTYQEPQQSYGYTQAGYSEPRYEYATHSSGYFERRPVYTQRVSARRHFHGRYECFGAH